MISTLILDLVQNAPKCSACEKTVKCNQKRFICDKCFDVTHGKCLNSQTLVLNSRAQCLSTSVDEFNVKLNTYGFDVISISETRLKENKDLINYVQIPRYEFIYNNREHSRGGGVAYYIK